MLTRWHVTSKAQQRAVPGEGQSSVLLLAGGSSGGRKPQTDEHEPAQSPWVSHGDNYRRWQLAAYRMLLPSASLDVIMEVQ